MSSATQPCARKPGPPPHDRIRPKIARLLTTASATIGSPRDQAARCRSGPSRRSGRGDRAYAAGRARTLRCRTCIRRSARQSRSVTDAFAVRSAWPLLSDTSSLRAERSDGRFSGIAAMSTAEWRWPLSALCLPPSVLQLAISGALGSAPSESAWFAVRMGASPAKRVFQWRIVRAAAWARTGGRGVRCVSDRPSAAAASWGPRG